MDKVVKIGKCMLMFILLLALTSCSRGTPVVKTVEEPSKESVDIFYKVTALTDTLKYKEARKLLEDRYDIIKDNDIVLNIYGDLEFHIFENYEKAEELFERAIKLNPINPEHYRRMGYIYEAKRQFKKAIKYYEKAVKRTANYENVPFNTKLADLYTDIGNCYLKLNERKKAIEALENAMEKNPYSIKMNALLHQLYVESEEYDKAYKVWKNDNLIDESEDHVYKRVLEWNRLYKAAVEGKNSMTHLQMADFYAALVLYDEAAIEYKKALAQDQANNDIKNKLYEMESYLSFRDELHVLLDEYYRERCINGTSEELTFYKRIKPAYEKIAGLFPQIENNSGITSAWIDILNKEIEKKFSVRIVNIKANGSMLGAHFGRIIDNSVVHSDLWSEAIDLEVITLKNMTSNGLDNWRTMGGGGVGGWSISQTEIVMVIQDNAYDGTLYLASVYSEEVRADARKQYAGILMDKEEKEPLQIYYSSKISAEFIEMQIITEAEKAKIKGVSDNDLQSYLFNKIQKDFKVRSNIIHESQHSIDNKIGTRLKWSGESEYRAKLSQLAYGNLQFMCLNQFYTSDLGMEVNNTHTRANTQVFKDIVQYIYDNSRKYPQIDVKKNILAQLTKLSDDDLKGIAIEIFQ
ncbi:MAG: hypothetical protein K0R80_488 [Clostridia bacterium]|nr:hypothetical protein [Clostridia bacterium]